MKIEREDFIKALALVKPALASGGVVQELNHLWFDTKFVYAYDGGFGIKLPLKTDLECGVPGTPLINLLGTSALKEAELQQEKDKLLLKFGKSTSKLALLELDRKVWNFPVKLPKNANPTPLGEDFIEALRRVLFIRASPQTRVEHYGVLVNVNKNDLELVTTDSKSMAAVTLKGAGKGAAFEKVLLPFNFAEEIVSQAPEGVDLYVLEDCLIAVADSVELYSNVLDVSATRNLSEIIQHQLDGHPKTVELPPGFEAALSRAEILAGKDEAFLSVGVNGAGLQLQGSYGLGSVQETLPLEGKLAEAKLRVLAEMLRRGLKHSESFSVSKESLLMKGGGGFIYVVAAL